MSFFRGAMRLIACEEALGDLIQQLDDIIFMGEGPHQYNLRLGMHDIGASKTGLEIIQENDPDQFDVDQFRGEIKINSTSWQMKVRTQIAEVHPRDFMNNWDTLRQGSRACLIALFQKPDRLIGGFVFSDARLLPMDWSGFQWRGENTSIPIAWSVGSALQIQQFKGQTIEPDLVSDLLKAGDSFKKWVESIA